MTKTWTQKDIEDYIDNEIEEGLMLDYKAAASLERVQKKLRK